MSNWDDDDYCIGCGSRNPIGMKLKFREEEEKLVCSYAFPVEFQGYKKHVHGGMISLLLDEIMVNLPIRKDGILAVSFELKIKLRKPLFVGEPVTAKAFYLKKKSRTFVIKGELYRDSDNVLIAESEAVCMKVDGEINKKI
ncbi:MAG: PaaI family thioesterase [Candidatus Goldiibacteriota bacterium]